MGWENADIWKTASCGGTRSRDESRSWQEWKGQTEAPRRSDPRGSTTLRGFALVNLIDFANYFDLLAWLGKPAIWCRFCAAVHRAFAARGPDLNLKLVIASF